jgi:thymidylate kinase
VTASVSGRTVALVGPDGAGKSTIARAVVDRLQPSAEYLYMGVNLEASTVMLPTTRLALALKRRRGGGSDMTAPGPASRRPAGIVETARRLVRMTNWIAEETYRAVLARRIQRRGATVVFDRHFFCDYYGAAIAPSPSRRLDQRIHGWILADWYPRPDLTIFLEAPVDVLLARKPGDSRDGVERRLRDYADLARILPAFRTVDADRPLEAVTADVVRLIVEFTDGETSDRTTLDGRPTGPSIARVGGPDDGASGASQDHAAAIAS